MDSGFKADAACANYLQIFSGEATEFSQQCIPLMKQANALLTQKADVSLMKQADALLLKKAERQMRHEAGVEAGIRRGADDAGGEGWEVVGKAGMRRR